MVEAFQVGEILGGEETLGSEINSLHRLERSVSSGLPKQALRAAAEHLFDEPKLITTLMYRLVPEATFKRRKRLSAAESERTERLARVIASAEFVWGNRDDARDWLTRPHPELSGVSPLDRSLTELGAREVEELLDKMFYGLPG